MVTLKIILPGWFIPYNHVSKHISAIITDDNSGREFNVNAPQGKGTIYANKEANNANRYLDNCHVGVITLYSNQDFDLFIEEYSKIFIKRIRSAQRFCLFPNNCSDAVAFALDYFCPQTQSID